MTEPSSADLAARCYLALGRLVRLLRRSGPAELGPGSFSALATLVGAGPLRLGDLAAREGVSAPTLSRIISSLEDGGHVVRLPDLGDRRAVHVAATAHGRASVEGIRAGRAAALAERIAALSPQQRDVLSAALPVLEALGQERQVD